MLPLKCDYSHVASLGGGGFISTDTARTQKPYATKDISSAFRLMSVDNVQVLLLLHGGTLASMRNLELSSRDFKISLIANERILFMKAKLGI